MALFKNPLGYAGFPATKVSAQTLNSTVRAATPTEVLAGTLNDVYVSPATLSGTSGSFTTLTSTGNTTLATGATATSVTIANAANSGALTVQIANGASGANSTVNILSGNGTAGTQTFTVLGGTRAGVANIGTGAAAHTLHILSSTGLLGFFGATSVVKQTQGAITNSVTSGGSTGVIANFTDLTTYATDAPTIRNDIYQLALGLQGCIAALRAYGLLA